MRIVKYSLVMVTFFVLGIFYFVQTARADSSIVEQWTANWSIDAHFTGNMPNVELTVEVFQSAALYDSTTIPLACIASEHVQFTSDKAVFEGEGWIECAIPPLEEIVFDLSNDQFELPSYCICKSTAEAATKVTLLPNFVPEDWSNPIIYLNGIEFSTPIDSGMNVYAQAEFMVDEEMSHSNLFSGVPGSDVAAFFQPVLPVLDYLTTFIINGIVSPGTPNVINGRLSISNEQPSFYIGYSPDTGESLHGVLETVHVDPGCFGNG